MEDAEMGGVAKITEYATRVASGEALESILEGLPTGMRRAVEEKVSAREKASTENDTNLPPQYSGMNSEAVDEIWTVPIYFDPEITRSERARKERVLARLRREEAQGEIDKEQGILREANNFTAVKEVQTKLGIQPSHTEQWQSAETVSDIGSMSVEDFAVWLVELARQKGTRLANSTAYEVLTARPEYRSARVTAAFGDSTPLLEICTKNGEAIKKFKEETELKVTAVDGVEYVSGTWDHYKIRYENRNNKETHKGYLTINKEQVLTAFTPEVRHEIVCALRDGGYGGQVKFPVTGSRALLSYDNIVLHGNDSENVKRGLEIVQRVLNNRNLHYDAPRTGVDQKSADGKTESYTERIAQLVEDAGKNSSMNLQQKIRELRL